MPLDFNAVPAPINDEDLPSFSANDESESELLLPKGIFVFDKEFRIVELDTHLLGTFFALALVMDLGDGTYKLDRDFSVRLSGDNLSEMKEVISGLRQDHIEYGHSSGTIKESLSKPYLVETNLSGVYMENSSCGN
ncbi:hypothetical protein QX249_10925 [Vibrio parahaemolyticus]|uniref:Uncharacterized protein n=1 Tax=Vibrio parahaemolyticus TaxID=670 RepID=A0AAW8Q1M5_VIBPH|nr:hypothetical protein [Vibrio parahaemolyticus]MDS1821175.1 hypothetical protein [Vibrio parahaemolyticus]